MNFFWRLREMTQSPMMSLVSNNRVNLFLASIKNNFNLVTEVCKIEAVKVYVFCFLNRLETIVVEYLLRHPWAEWEWLNLKSRPPRWRLKNAIAYHIEKVKN